jgi:hypothetical protein
MVLIRIESYSVVVEYASAFLVQIAAIKFSSERVFLCNDRKVCAFYPANAVGADLGSETNVYPNQGTRVSIMCQKGVLEGLKVFSFGLS